jgi:hypothetical protein
MPPHTPAPSGSQCCVPGPRQRSVVPKHTSGAVVPPPGRPCPDLNDIIGGEATPSRGVANDRFGDKSSPVWRPRWVGTRRKARDGFLPVRFRATRVEIGHSVQGQAWSEADYPLLVICALEWAIPGCTSRRRRVPPKLSTDLSHPNGRFGQQWHHVGGAQRRGNRGSGTLQKGERRRGLFAPSQAICSRKATAERAGRPV